MQLIFERVRAQPKRVVFAEGEEEKTIRAALALRNAGYGTPVLIGREERIHETDAAMRPQPPGGLLEIHNARLSTKNRAYAEFLYAAQQRSGMLVPRLPAPGQPGPQRVRRLHGRRRAMPMRW